MQNEGYLFQDSYMCVYAIFVLMSELYVHEFGLYMQMRQHAEKLPLTIYFLYRLIAQ